MIFTIRSRETMHFYLNLCILSISCRLYSKAVNRKVNGGTYTKNRYMSAHVILGVEKVGPKMCVADCMRYHGCNAVNFNRNKLSCEILNITYPRDETAYSDGMYFTEIDNWRKIIERPSAVQRSAVHVYKDCLAQRVSNVQTNARTKMNKMTVQMMKSRMNQMEQNQCWPNPCTGRKKCVVVYNGGHVCINFVAPCDSHRCENKGECRNQVNGYRCLCQTGYSGTYCETTPCTGKICYNGGHCVITGSSWLCSCQPGYYGSVCQYTPCTDRTCLHGGTCVVIGSTWSCDCRPGYLGSQCQSYLCDFETTPEASCLFVQDTTSQQNWTRATGSTPSIETGPVNAFSGSYYLFMETSGVTEGHTARLIWRNLQISCGASLYMCYHMYGIEMGTLNIYQDTSVLWQMSGDQGNSWKCTTISLAVKNSEIIIEAVRGTGYKSDIAIDNIKLNIDIC